MSYLNPEFAVIAVPFLKIALAAVLGILVGIERTFAGKTAGMRTYALVAVGASILTVLGTSLIEQYSGLPNIKADPLIIISGIMTGVGFLGAGIIFHQKSRASGLTTAAGIWVVAAIGIAVGAGFYSLAVFSALVTLFIFSVLLAVEIKVRKKYLKERQGRGGR